MGRLFVALQCLLPQHLLSRAAGWLAETRIGWLRRALIAWFIRRFEVDMREAAQPDPRRYDSFNAFFTRALAAGARPIDGDPAVLVCPADGSLSQLGAIRDGRVHQAKGRSFTTLELLGGDRERAAAYAAGSFATIYLSPRDYHRVHMPIDGRLAAQTYIPGRLFPVNRLAAERVPRLFARNERLVCHFETAAGPMALILVGALIVAGIETVWGAPRRRMSRWPRAGSWGASSSAPRSSCCFPPTASTGGPASRLARQCGWGRRSPAWRASAGQPGADAAAIHRAIAAAQWQS